MAGLQRNCLTLKDLLNNNTKDLLLRLYLPGTGRLFKHWLIEVQITLQSMVPEKTYHSLMALYSSVWRYMYIDIESYEQNQGFKLTCMLKGNVTLKST